MRKLCSANVPVIAEGDGARSPDEVVKFEYVPHRQNIPNAELLDDLRQVAQKLAVSTFTIEVYKLHGKFYPQTIAKRFGGWRAATLAAGLVASRHYNLPTEEIIQDIQRVAREVGTDRLAQVHYKSKGIFGRTTIRRIFGGWQKAVIAAGLRPEYYTDVTEQDLFDNLKLVWQRLGRQPTVEDMVPPLSKFGKKIYAKQFGGFGKALQAFVQSSPSADPLPEPTQLLPIVRHTTSRWINLRLRFQIMRRDQFRCMACGRSPAMDPSVQLQVDHILPWHHGGETTVENLQTLCQVCNVGKSDSV